jgi:hypothetical protein
VFECVGGKDIISLCAALKIRNLSVSHTNPSFEDVLETNFPNFFSACKKMENV